MMCMNLLNAHAVLASCADACQAVKAVLAVQRAEVGMRLGRRASNLAGGLGHGLQKHGSVANIMKGLQPLQRGLGSNLVHLTGLHPLGQAVSR